MLRSILLSCALGLSLISCLELDKLEELTQFDLPYSTTGELPASASVNIPFVVKTSDIQTNSESEFSLKNTSADRVEEVVLKELTLTILRPSGATFSPLKSVVLSIKAGDKAATGIAWKENVSDEIGNVLELEVSNENLKDYILEDVISMELQVVTDEITTETYEIKADAVFGVDAKILGL